MRHLYWDGAWRNSSGTPLGTLPIAWTAWTPIVTSAAPDNFGDVWIRDMYRNPVTGRIFVVFNRFVTETDHRHYWGWWNGARWQVVEIPGAVSAAMPPVEEQYYSPGSHLDAEVEGDVFISLGDDTACDLFLYSTRDFGVTWTRRRISPVAVPGERYRGQNCRPVVPQGRDDRARVIWWHGQMTYFDADVPDGHRAFYLTWGE